MKADSSLQRKRQNWKKKKKDKGKLKIILSVPWNQILGQSGQHKDPVLK